MYLRIHLIENGFVSKYNKIRNQKETEESTVNPNSETPYCPYCGSPVPAGTELCPYCHANLAENANYAQAGGQAVTPDPVPTQQDPRYAQPTPGYAPPTPGYAQPTPGYAPQASGYAPPAPGYAPQTPGYAQPTPGYAPPTPGYAQPAPGYAPQAPGYAAPPPGYGTPNYGYRGPAGGARPPALQLRSNRALWKYIVFGMLTIGIYDIIVDCHMVRDLNTLASPYDGRRTMHPLLVILLGVVTLGIYPLIWSHKYANRVSTELKRRGIRYSFSAKHFWLWNVLGSMILVGPYIFKHRQMFSTNKLCADYNLNG